MKIYIDADACPRKAKEILFRCSERFNIKLVLVANQHICTPQLTTIKNIVVSDGFNDADDKIVELCMESDLVITSDIPLADRVIKKGSLVLTPRGEWLDEDSIGHRLAVRNLLEDLRNSGMQTGGPTAYSEQDKREFANAMDRYLHKIKK